MRVIVSKSPSTLGLSHKRGFASMPKQRVLEIAKRGGLARAMQLGRKGFSEMGQKGGLIRARQLGGAGFVFLGQRGGTVRARQLGMPALSTVGKRGAKARVIGCQLQRFRNMLRRYGQGKVTQLGEQITKM